MGWSTKPMSFGTRIWHPLITTTRSCVRFRELHGCLSTDPRRALRERFWWYRVSNIYWKAGKDWE